MSHRLVLDLTTAVLLDADTGELIIAYYGGEYDPDRIILSLGSLEIATDESEDLVAKIVEIIHHEMIHWVFWHEGLANDDEQEEHHAVDWAMERLAPAYAPA